MLSVKKVVHGGPEQRVALGGAEAPQALDVLDLDPAELFQVGLEQTLPPPPLATAAGAGVAAMLLAPQPLTPTTMPSLLPPPAPVSLLPPLPYLLTLAGTYKNPNCAGSRLRLP